MLRPPLLGKPALSLGSPSLDAGVGMLALSELSGQTQHALHRHSEWPSAKWGRKRDVRATSLAPTARPPLESSPEQHSKCPFSS